MDSQPEYKLAVIIPAYKKEFLEEALQCLADQTNKDFVVYIGNDASPENLEEIIHPFYSRMKIIYQRFANRIGARNIVDQWKRCIGLSQNEEWIWLFSDDDKADAGAVASFYEALERTKEGYDIYSFNTCVIDGTGEVKTQAPPVPPCESSEDLAYNLLKGLRANCMADHIFSRKIYLRKGLPFTCYGQGADWATSISFSSEKGICYLSGALIHWRYSGLNISSTAHQNKSRMIVGHFQFINWICRHFRYLRNEPEGSARYEQIKNAARENLLRIIDEHYRAVPLRKLVPFALLMRKNFGTGWKEIYFLSRKLNTITRRTTAKPKSRP